MKLKVISVILASVCSLAAQAECQLNQRISQIQGLGKQSLLLGQQVQTAGVVSAVLYPKSKDAALLVHSLTPDQDNRSSEALLIADSQLAAQYKVGQLLQLTGTVTERHGMTALEKVQATTCGNQTIPAAVEFTLPVKSKADWEAVEGMLLSFPQSLVVNDSYPLARYGEILLADKRLWVATELMPAGKEANAFEQQQRLSEIWLDDGLSQQNPEPIRYPTGGLNAKHTVRVGDTVHNLQAYLIETKQGYRLIPASEPQFASTNPRQPAPSAKVAGSIRVASFNVLNFFTGETAAAAFPTRRGASTAEELARQQAKMLAALSVMDADVIGLLEVENNGTDAHSAIATIVRELNKTLGAERYAFVQPAGSQGTDAIKVAMIYDQTRLKQSGQAAVISTGPFAYGSRAPLAQSFAPLNGGESFTVSINHFKSKGSCPEDKNSVDADHGQGCWTHSRVEAAKAANQWLQSQPTGVHTANQLLIGDLNAYRKEDPLLQLAKDGWLHLAPEHDGKAHYSYVYRGRTGSLDHALASKSLADKLQQFQHWNINADEPAILDYNMEFKSKTQLEQLYAPDAFRSSDHDPVLMDFKF
ncbi:ExeM/NucH family extracellular endonuclease [Rheinheimera marina]|uniref:ExeM/NucH family extracellular endonuclease n=1 Tax=Rheinheimera marina TaxID=1774958 RepID=A0ABV9JPT2_9GAMM